jgi:tRNA(fMet)-specific endonuclease VapC
MSLYALDTDTLSLWQHGHVLVSQRVAAHRPDELAVTVITVQEQLDGWRARLPRARKPQQIADLYRRLAYTVRFLSRVSILDYTESAVHRFDQLRAQCPNVGFRRIPGLAVEDWSQ